MKVKILRYHAVASWHWDIKEDMCGICREPFDGCCPDCTMPGDGCPPVWGECNHVFHLHCILKWSEKKDGGSKCPMCRQDWREKKAD